MTYALPLLTNEYGAGPRCVVMLIPALTVINPNVIPIAPKLRITSFELLNISYIVFYNATRTNSVKSLT